MDTKAVRVDIKRSRQVAISSQVAGVQEAFDLQSAVHDPTELEDRIIAEAAEILRRRLMRLGSLGDPTKASEFLRMRIGGIEHEVFYVMYLDSRHHIIASEVAFSGTIDGAEIYPREVVKRALRQNAAAIICAHNHPSGNPEPSAADRAVTARIKQALALVDVRLLDHFVVTGDRYTSLAARGWV
jgi:DNA repair protein RadC